MHFEAGTSASWCYRFEDVLRPGTICSSREIESAYPASMLFMENDTDDQRDEVRVFNRVLSENEICASAAP